MNREISTVRSLALAGCALAAMTSEAPAAGVITALAMLLGGFAAVIEARTFAADVRSLHDDVTLLRERVARLEGRGG